MKTFGWSSQETQHSRTEMSWADGAQATVKHYGVQLNAKRQQLIQSSQSNPCSDVIKYVHKSEEIKMMGHFQVSSLLTPHHGSCSMKTLPKLFNSTLLTRELELSQFRSKIQVKISNQLELLSAKLFNSSVSLVADCKTMPSTDERQSSELLCYVRAFSLLCLYTQGRQLTSFPFHVLSCVAFAAYFRWLSITLWSSI